MFLMSHFGKILSVSDKRIVQVSLGDIEATDALVVLGSDQSGFFLSASADRLRRLDTWTGIVGRGVIGSYLSMEHDPDGPVVALRSQRGYLRALDDLSIDYTQQHADDWEKFRLVSGDDLRLVIQVVQGRLASGGRTHAFDPASTTNRHIRFGSVSVPIEGLLRNRASLVEVNEVVTFDGWSPTLHRIYRPAILYLIFGMGNLIEQLSCSLLSLKEFGRYAGRIIIATNNDPNTMREICRGRGFDDVLVMPIEAIDRLDFVGTRITMLADGALDAYAPILYVDADIVFDRDINPLLEHAVSLTKVSAQFEQHNWLQLSPETGMTLFEQKPFDVPQTKGFCAGILLVPSGRGFRRYFEAALQCLLIYTGENGRDSIPYYDQSVLNYVFHKLEIIEASPVTERTRLWPIDDDGEPAGFVHFWDGREQRHQRMLDYISKRRAAIATEAS